jgi:tetratricopeptide (TPR) repeat protein
MLMRVLTLAPERSADVVAVADAFVANDERERAYGCIEVAADAALFESDFERAAAVLEKFVTSGGHIPALMKLVEVCVDAAFDERLRAAQAQLADAYLDAGRAAEARVIAEDLLARDTTSEANRQRLLRALLALGIDHPEEELARAAEPNEFLGEPLDLSIGEPAVHEAPEPAALEPAPTSAPVDAEPAPDAASARVAASEVSNEDTIVLDALEVDLSETLATMGAASPMLPPAPSSPAEEPVQAPADLESVFEAMRARAANESRGASPSAADEVYERAQQHLQAGRWAEAVNDLERAARTPALRFMAASQLGRLFIARGESGPGTEWLERAAEAPAPTAEDAAAVLYDLAYALEKMGESARALAIFMEILVDSGRYRDVSERVDRLARVQAESHGA